MQNKVINHLSKNKIVYAILGIVAAVIGFMLVQTPNFSDQGLSGNVGNLPGQKAVSFLASQDLKVSKEGTVSFAVVTEPGAKAQFYFVNENRKQRAHYAGSVIADTNGLAIYSGTVSSKLKEGVTYDIGVQATLATGKRALALADYSVRVTDQVTAAASNMEESNVRAVGELKESQDLKSEVSVADKVALKESQDLKSEVSVADKVALKEDVTLTDGSTSVSTEVSSEVSSPITLESNVSNTEVSFAVPSTSTRVAIGEKMVVAIRAANAEEKFTLYAVDAASGAEIRFAKGVTSGQEVAWAPEQTGVYNLVAAGEESQWVSEFTVSVYSTEMTSETDAVTATVTREVTVTNEDGFAVTNTTSESADGRRDPLIIKTCDGDPIC